MTVADRVFACLQGIAIGDAIGKQTEMLGHQDIVRWYPDGIQGFEGPPDSVIPRYRGNRKHEWRIGETTDDTERTIAVARALIADGGAVSHVSIGREMLRCTKSVHPGVRSLWEFHQAGDPARIASEHDGCGAAIRAAPAAAVSSAIDGGDPHEVIAHAERSARRLSVPFAKMVRRIHDDLQRLAILRPPDLAAMHFPDGPMTIVPLALGLATVMRSARHAILMAANVGGDSDSVASIAGGILGAAYPDTVDEEWADIVERANGHGLEAIARQLAGLRR